MSQHNPFEPIAIKNAPRAQTNRPYYIYATAIMLLVWAAVFRYLQLNYGLSEAEGVVYISFPDPNGTSFVGANVFFLIAMVLASIVVVNLILWGVMAMWQLRSD